MNVELVVGQIFTSAVSRFPSAGFNRDDHHAASAGRLSDDVERQMHGLRTRQNLGSARVRPECRLADVQAGGHGVTPASSSSGLPLTAFSHPMTEIFSASVSSRPSRISRRIASGIPMRNQMLP